MKKVAIPSYITGVPSDPVEFGEDSIIIEDDGVEFLVGKAASERDPNAYRRFHGNLKRPQYRRLIKALVAALVGENEVTSDVALAAPKPAMEGLRKEAGSILFNEEQWKLFCDAVSEIKFRKGSSRSPQRICKINFESGKLFYETQAVKESIPNNLKSLVLWQLGHGDFQQISFIDHKPRFDTHVHEVGLSGAIKIFQKLTGHAAADAEEGWRAGYLSRPGGMNGDQYTDEEYNSLKRKALKEYFGTLIPKILNLNEPYKARARNVILSGGGAKDRLAVEVLREEVEIEGHYKLHLISDLPIKDERCDDSSFTCVNGLLAHAKLALDPGNSFLKGGLNV